MQLHCCLYCVHTFQVPLQKDTGTLHSAVQMLKCSALRLIEFSETVS